MEMHKCMSAEEEHNIQMKWPGICLAHGIGGETLPSFIYIFENTAKVEVKSEGSWGLRITLNTNWTPLFFQP